jgi:cyanophycin synthetase
MNIFSFRDFEVMIDYVHNTDGFNQLKEFMRTVNAELKIGIIGCAGDRRDEDIKNMGRSAAEMFDEIIIRHDRDNRGRTKEDLTNLITKGIQSVKPGAVISVISDELEAIAHAMEHARKGTFIVVSSDDVQRSIEFVTAQKQGKPSLAHEV